MKKNFLSACGTVLFFMLLFTSCKKENFYKKDTCRLESWQGLDDGYLRKLHYNDEGLLDEWKETAPLYEVNQVSTFEYDNKKRVSRMKYYDQDKFLNTVIPVYERGRLTKELWYIADTETLDDTVVNIYDGNGRIVKRESLQNDFYASFKYDAIGNVTQVKVLGTDGTLYFSVIMYFDKPVREPMVAVPGLPYPIQYTDYMISKRKYTYLKVFGLDDESNHVAFYEHDTEKSELRAGPEGYAVYYNTFDKVSGVSNRQVWEYQNCDCDEDDVQQFNQHAFKGSTSISKNKRLPYTSMVQMRERIKQIRKLNRR